MHFMKRVLLKGSCNKKKVPSPVSWVKKKKKKIPACLICFCQKWPENLIINFFWPYLEVWVCMNCQALYSENLFLNTICWEKYSVSLGGSVGCAVRLETRRSRVQPPPRSATFFHGDWSWNIFYGHSLPSADSRRAVVSFWRKNVHNTG